MWSALALGLFADTRLLHREVSLFLPHLRPAEFSKDVGSLWCFWFK